MPLPSVLNGANQCQVITKRTKQRCKNPAAYGCCSCRMHGAHKSRNVPKGVMHKRYTKGEKTKEVLEENRKARCRLAMLEQIGWHLKMFTGTRTRGRKPKGYSPLDLNDSKQSSLTIVKALISESSI